MGFTRPGGVRATIFNLLNATAGAAVIAMPEAVRASGLGFSFFQLIMACLVNYISSSTLLYTSFEWGLFSYSELSANCHGKLYCKFVDLFYFVNVFGTTLSYSVLVQGNLVTSFGFIRSKYWEAMPEVLDNPKSIFWVLCFATILIPLVIKRQLKSLTIYSFLGFLTIIYLMIVTISSTFDKRMSNYFFEYEKLKLANWAGCLYTFPVFIFSFTTQINLLQCFQELEKPTLRRMHKVLAKQHFICFTIYMFIGIFGYLSFPTDDGGASASFIQRYNPIENFAILIVTEQLNT